MLPRTKDLNFKQCVLLMCLTEKEIQYQENANYSHKQNTKQLYDIFQDYSMIQCDKCKSFNKPKKLIIISELKFCHNCLIRHKKEFHYKPFNIERKHASMVKICKCGEINLTCSECNDNKCETCNLSI